MWPSLWTAMVVGPHNADNHVLPDTALVSRLCGLLLIPGRASGCRRLRSMLFPQRTGNGLVMRLMRCCACCAAIFGLSSMRSTGRRLSFKPLVARALLLRMCAARLPGLLNVLQQTKEWY